MEKSHLVLLNNINSNYEILERFAGGMSNYTYLINDKNTQKKYVFRIKGENGEKYVDYGNEEKNIKKVENLNLISPTIYFDVTQGIKICEYIEGNNIKDEIDYLKICDLLKKLHTSSISLSTYNHLQRLNTYESYHHNILNKYFTLKDEWLNLYENNLKFHINYPCHGDVQASNIIIDKLGNYHLLDWEFSGMNDYIYDIASFGNNGFEKAEMLFKAYLVKPSNEEYKRLYSWRMFQCLQWFNVASTKNEDGLSETLNINFANVADFYLMEAEKMLNKALLY